MDDVTEKFIGDLILKEHNRMIAAILGGIEDLLGKKTPEISKSVKDIANASKRIMYTQITKTEVEPKYVGSGQHEQASE
jgi:hypothetical protein